MPPERLNKLVLTEKVLNAHRRISKHDKKIEVLEESRHKHEAILVGIVDGMKEWSKATRENTKALQTFRGMVIAVLVLGSAFGSFVIFVTGTVLKWWS